MLARVFATATCLSICHEPVLRQNEEMMMIFSPSGSPMILVFRCQISSQNATGSPRAGASKKGGGGNSAIF